MNQIDVDIEQTTQEISTDIETQTGVYWGNIAGNIENQTDLKDALDAKINRSGGIMSGSIKFVTVGQNGAIRGTTDGIIFGYVDNDESYTTHTIGGFIREGFIPNYTDQTLGSSNAKWDTAYITKINNGQNIRVPSQSGTMVVATPPENNGVYVLKCTVQDGTRTFEWVEE